MSSIEPDRIVRVGRAAAAGSAAPRARVAIGFGSPAGDTGVTRLDLNDILVRHPQASYLMRVAGDALRDWGIAAGDLLLIDRALAPAHGHIVVAVVDGEFLCRRLGLRGGVIRLQAPQQGCADMVAGEGCELQLCGVVTQVIKAMPL